MRTTTLAPSLFLTFLAPSLAVASWWDGSRPDQLAFRPSSMRRAARPDTASTSNPSVVVAVVDPASPTTSSIVDASSLSSAAEAEDDDEDRANFGEPCTFTNTFQTCGDYFDGELDHGLFCSPSMRLCGGKGAACGATEACNEDLVCNLSTHRCVTATAELLRAESSRQASRRKSAAMACPEGAEACSSGFGFECVHTPTDDQHCGGCAGLGGVDCSLLDNALATSCRNGSCQIHACVAGFHPNEEKTECLDEMLYA
ncbi:hypothetical protein JCM8547_004274 [Rhodosporidiobolus lusitaniae]